jgi:hypothetical protein
MTSDPSLYISVIQSVLIAQSNLSLGSYTDLIGAEGGPVNGVLNPGAAMWAEQFKSGYGVGFFSINAAATVGAIDTAENRSSIRDLLGGPEQLRELCGGRPDGGPSGQHHRAGAPTRNGAGTVDGLEHFCF